MKYDFPLPAPPMTSAKPLLTKGKSFLSKIL